MSCRTCYDQKCKDCLKKPKNKCGKKTEVFSRVCGYHRPVKNWNKGQQAQFGDRKTFDKKKAGIAV